MMCCEGAGMNWNQHLKPSRRRPDRRRFKNRGKAPGLRRQKLKRNIAGESDPKRGPTAHSPRRPVLFPHAGRTCSDVCPRRRRHQHGHHDQNRYDCSTHCTFSLPDVISHRTLIGARQVSKTRCKHRGVA